MDKYYVCILLCIVQRLTVKGQMLVSHKKGVIVSSSSQYNRGDTYNISYAVDGNTRTDADNCRCCSATYPDVSPWFKIDLLQKYMIQRIHILGPTETRYTLYKMEIQLNTTKSDGTVLQGVNTSYTSLHELNFTLISPEPARYITLTLRDEYDQFIICEIYVYAECSRGKYGPGCINKCGKCQNNEPCDGVTGECPWCNNGYQSPQCQECQAGTFGFNCKQLCGMCHDGDVCDIYTGACPNGCTDEYKGSQCSQKINQDTLPCSDACISLPLSIVSLCAVVVLTVIGLSWLYYRRRLNKKSQNKGNNEDPPIPLPNIQSNYESLRLDNLNGESTYTEINRRA